MPDAFGGTQKVAFHVLLSGLVLDARTLRSIDVCCRFSQAKWCSPIQC